MNFLAHCLLADLATDSKENSGSLIAGGVLADFHRGPMPDHWPDDLSLGVALHRRVDAFSNALTGIRASCDRFPKPLRRFAPIFVDIHADRSLSQVWSGFHGDGLPQFAQRCYDLVEQAHPLMHGLDPRAERFVSYMREVDLLASYQDWSHVAQGVEVVCKRLRRPALAVPAVEAMQTLDETLRSDFEDYFPELIQEARRFIAER